jgi:hypothetical protein
MSGGRFSVVSYVILSEAKNLALNAVRRFTRFFVTFGSSE